MIFCLGVFYKKLSGQNPRFIPEGLPKIPGGAERDGQRLFQYSAKPRISSIRRMEALLFFFFVVEIYVTVLERDANKVLVFMHQRMWKFIGMLSLFSLFTKNTSSGISKGKFQNYGMDTESAAWRSFCGKM